MSIPRSEYPRPQFVRDAWVNLNGEWDFEIDYTMSGEEKKFFERDSLNQKIIVPFCPESELSGIGNCDFMPCVWYRRNFDVPKQYEGKDVILHFGAVDYRAVIYINGQKAGEHTGGYTSFSFNITEFLKDDGNYVTVCAYDDTRSLNQATGKQSDRIESFGCFYTRTTGIWQTVWLEFADKRRVNSIRITADIDTPSVTVGVKIPSEALGSTVRIEALWDGEAVGCVSTALYSLYTELNILLSEKHLWEIGKGGLYDLDITLEDNGTICDSVKSYFGLRSVALDGMKFKVNNEVVFGRWVLDQGFYPDGIYTAPTDEALKNDILYSMQLGFNGARMHEKVFEPRYIYWADKLGYMVWGEHANWELDITEMSSIEHFLPEWLEVMDRDMSHPSIIGWCPLNETWDFAGRKQYDEVVRIIYRVTKAVDPTRPVIDTSGNFHVESDIFDVHDYEQNPKTFASHYEKLTEGIMEDTVYSNPTMRARQSYNGTDPTFVSEYGGIRWSPDKEEGWGYGDTPKSEQEFIERYKGLTEALLNNPYMLGFCYTQLYDVEQEVNGLMTYDRKFKFDPEIIRKINEQPAAIETEECE
ncbi:MAG: glycoside hydrolase family 2 TIM barrel-domain containing protein [Clostridiales bacterium]|nr:glycoside hydrolase family 2 TIM barrel-domain containing protein [Clostridiales bacterium]